MKKILLAGNGSFNNHGCEAITLGIIEILYHTFGPLIQITYAAHNNKEDCEKDLGLIKNVNLIASEFMSPIKKYSQAWFEYQLNRLVNTSFPGGFKSLEKIIMDSDIVIAIGGDNYSFDYGYPERYLQFDRTVIRHGKPLLYWGVSVGPFTADERYEKKMSSHFKKISMIMARETGTIKYLQTIGQSENVNLVSDPAFAMPPIQPRTSNFRLTKKDFLGVNFSTTVGRLISQKAYESTPNSLSNLEGSDYKIMCDKYTDISISLYKLFSGNLVFIPHSMGEESHNDYKFMKDISSKMEELGYEGILLVPSNLSAPEYKWIISQSRIFIGARTHSTIASFSSGVPTITLSYSLKARGITTDMYGEDKYCISGKDINPTIITLMTEQLMKEELQVRKQLKTTSEIMVERAYLSGSIIKKYLGDS